MGLEFLFKLKRYVVIESVEICDNLVRHVYTEYGPYFFKARAQTKIAGLKKDRIKDGWEQNEEAHLSKKTSDIHYFIKPLENDTY